MGVWFSILRRHPMLRAAALAIFLYGFAGAATSPYQSFLAIQELGLSDSAYAWIALLASLVNVTMAIAAGLLSDQLHSYRAPLIFVSAFGALGYGLIWALPSPLTFVLATIGPLALFHATNSMLFGAVRAQTDRFDPNEARIVNALMRIMISLSWVLMPGVVGLIMRGQDSMIAVWAIAAVVAAACMATILFGLKTADEPAPPTARPTLGDLRLIISPGLSGSLLAVNYFLGGALGAGVFGLGTSLGGYGLTALLSGALGVIGALLLWGMEHGQNHA